MVSDSADNGSGIGTPPLDGRTPRHAAPAYHEYGPSDGAGGPVVVAVPHAGREYSDGLLAIARGGTAALRALEDRYADRLAAAAIAAGRPVLVARRARAELDLNRHELEIDDAGVRGIPPGTPVRASAKLRGGLGLIPRHYHGAGDLWTRRIDFVDVEERLATLHRPYHRRLAQLLDDARRVHGRALLIDLHSMPPIVGDANRPQVVLGDLWGGSAAPAIVDAAMHHLAGEGLRVALNRPYAGAYVLDRHGRPGRGVHAIQVEVDRSLYLDAALEEPGPGMAGCVAIIGRLVDALAATFGPANTVPLAAE